MSTLESRVYIYRATSNQHPNNQARKKKTGKRNKRGTGIKTYMQLETYDSDTAMTARSSAIQANMGHI